jgi:hypothetical protein
MTMEGYEKHEFPKGMLERTVAPYRYDLELLRELAAVTPRSSGTEYVGLSRGVAVVRRTDDVRAAAEAWETANPPPVTRKRRAVRRGKKGKA